MNNKHMLKILFSGLILVQVDIFAITYTQAARERVSSTKTGVIEQQGKGVATSETRQVVFSAQELAQQREEFGAAIESLNEKINALLAAISSDESGNFNQYLPDLTDLSGQYESLRANISKGAQSLGDMGLERVEQDIKQLYGTLGNRTAQFYLKQDRVGRDEFRVMSDDYLKDIIKTIQAELKDSDIKSLHQEDNALVDGIGDIEDALQNMEEHFYADIENYSNYKVMQEDDVIKNMDQNLKNQLKTSISRFLVGQKEKDYSVFLCVSFLLDYLLRAGGGRGTLSFNDRALLNSARDTLGRLEEAVIRLEVFVQKILTPGVDGYYFKLLSNSEAQDIQRVFVTMRSIREYIDSFLANKHYK